MGKTTKTRKIYRSAVTGKIVTREFADANPDTTVADTVNLPASKPEQAEKQDAGK